MRRVAILLVPLLLLAGGATLAAGAGGRPPDRALWIGFQLTAGPVDPARLDPSCVPVPVPPAGGTSSGTWSAAGALADAGEAAACFRLAPAGDRLRLDGALRLVSPQGTITLGFRGVAQASGPQPPAALLQAGRVTAWRVTAATGAFAGLRARGRGEVVANLGRGDITVVLRGRDR
jgi:hypothetical protein